jgi:hypothetical protein
MSIITDSYNPRAVLLTHIQKGVLAVIYNSPTPQMAFQSTIGDESLVLARNLLERLGLVKVTNNQAILTPDGELAVRANNLVDETGKLSDDGAEVVDWITGNKIAPKKVSEASEFALLKGFIEP